VKRVMLKKLVPEAKVPEYQTGGAAGADIHALEAHKIYPGCWALIGTGVAIEVPADFEVQVRSRSGLTAKHGIIVLNSPGTIDSDYRGEVKVCLFNCGYRAFEVNPGDRIAQLVLASVERAVFDVVHSLGATERGEGGIGSTGVTS
jgi:dUTP pyrophosphatase